MDRRKFFGFAAATGVAAAVPARAFVRTFKDREALEGEYIPAEDETDIIIRLYHGDELVHTQKASLPAVVIKNKDGSYSTRIGAYDHVLMDGFIGTMEYCSVAVAAFPRHEIKLAIPDGPYVVTKGNTLTLSGPEKGFIELT